MSWFTHFLSSSIGKKVQMAVTGILLGLFLIVHLIGNLFLFAGPEAFNAYVSTLDVVKPFIRVIEVILALIFLGHIINALLTTLENRRSNPGKYEVNRAQETSSFFSRTMGWTGSILFIFLVVHLSTIWWRFQLQHEGGQFYGIVMGDEVGFGNLIVTILYAVAMLLLGFHLRHGFLSAFQTLGIRYTKYGKLLEWIAVIFWLIIPLGFISIPIYFGFMKGGF